MENVSNLTALKDEISCEIIENLERIIVTFDVYDGYDEVLVIDKEGKMYKAISKDGRISKFREVQPQRIKKGE